MLSELAGGATAIPAVGSYMSKKYGMVVEDVTVLKVCVDVDSGILREVRNLAVWVARVLKQESVLVMVDHTSFLIEGVRGML